MTLKIITLLNYFHYVNDISSYKSRIAELWGIICKNIKTVLFTNFCAKMHF